MYYITSIFGALIALSIIIIVHEYGHFWVARRFGVKVDAFSIGFGRAIYSRTALSGTTFRIGWIPIGGYVKLHGDELDKSTTTSNDNTAYQNKSVWIRMCIVLAGPAVNFILAILIYWTLYCVGIPNLKPIIEKVKPGSLAAQAQLKANDQVTHIDGYAIHNWSRAILILVSHYRDTRPITLKVKNRNSSTSRNVQLDLKNWTLQPNNPNIFSSLGWVPRQPSLLPTIATIAPDSPAARAGLKANDTIIAINSAPYTTFTALHKKIQTIGNKPLILTIKRNKKILKINITPKPITRSGKKIFMLGIMPKAHWPPNLLSTTKFNIADAFSEALQETQLLTHVNTVILYKLISGQFPFTSLGGPIMIFSLGGKTIHAGIIPYCLFIAFISISIGFLNLLPIPGLDGGHFLFQIVEVIKRKPISAKWQLFWVKVGFAGLLILMLIITRNDIIRLIS